MRAEEGSIMTGELTGAGILEVQRKIISADAGYSVGHRNTGIPE